MIRFIIKHKSKELNGLEIESFFTIDNDLGLLEAALSAGGCGEDGYSMNVLVGVELIKVSAT